MGGLFELVCLGIPSTRIRDDRLFVCHRLIIILCSVELCQRLCQRSVVPNNATTASQPRPNEDGAPRMPPLLLHRSALLSDPPAKMRPAERQKGAESGGQGSAPALLLAFVFDMLDMPRRIEGISQHFFPTGLQSGLTPAAPGADPKPYNPTPALPTLTAATGSGVGIWAVMPARLLDGGRKSCG